MNPCIVCGKLTSAASTRSHGWAAGAVPHNGLRTCAPHATNFFINPPETHAERLERGPTRPRQWRLAAGCRALMGRARAGKVGPNGVPGTPLHGPASWKSAAERGASEKKHRRVRGSGVHRLVVEVGHGPHRRVERRVIGGTRRRGYRRHGRVTFALFKILGLAAVRNGHRFAF